MCCVRKITPVPYYQVLAYKFRLRKSRNCSRAATGGAVVVVWLCVCQPPSLPVGGHLWYLRFLNYYKALDELCHNSYMYYTVMRHPSSLTMTTLSREVRLETPVREVHILPMTWPVARARTQLQTRHRNDPTEWDLQRFTCR